ncbi:hypothetical protein DSECCO2_408070 [anaerobic digester metagenome]
MAAMSRSSILGLAMASLLISSMWLAPSSKARLTPWLAPLTYPRFSSFSIISSSGYRSLRMETEPSVEPLSTTSTLTP